MSKELKRFIRIIVVVIVIGIIISALAVIVLEEYRRDYVFVHYVIADDYSYVVRAYNKDQTFSPIEKLPDPIDEESRGLPWSGRIEGNKSQTATCYEYEYEGVVYLEIEIYEKKLITFGEDNSYIVLYYVEDTQ